MVSVRVQHENTKIKLTADNVENLKASIDTTWPDLVERGERYYILEYIDPDLGCEVTLMDFEPLTPLMKILVVPTASRTKGRLSRN